MFSLLSKVENGTVATLSKESRTVVVGASTADFKPPAIVNFVSGKEQYKQTFDMFMNFVDSMDVALQEKPHLNFAWIDQFGNS